jgi:hypothetical protein
LIFRRGFLQALAGELRTLPSERPGPKAWLERPIMFCGHGFRTILACGGARNDRTMVYMEIDQILREFERPTGRFARAAVEAAVERREEITPELLRILEETTQRAAELVGEEDYMAHLYAMYLLAQFRETRAYPLVVRFASLPGDLLDSLCGDFIAEGLENVLASVCGGELGGIQSLIENEDIDQWVRGSAVSSLATLAASGQKSREDVLSYYASLFRGKLVRELSYVWCALCPIAPTFTRRNFWAISSGLTKRGWLTPALFASKMSSAPWR